MLPGIANAFPENNVAATTAADATMSFFILSSINEQKAKQRKRCFPNIKKAAEYHGIDMTQTDWTQLGKTPHTGRTAEDRAKSARKAAATRKRHEHESE